MWALTNLACLLGIRVAVKSLTSTRNTHQPEICLKVAGTEGWFEQLMRAFNKVKLRDLQYTSHWSLPSMGSAATSFAITNSASPYNLKYRYGWYINWHANTVYSILSASSLPPVDMLINAIYSNPEHTPPQFFCGFCLCSWNKPLWTDSVHTGWNHLDNASFRASYDIFCWNEQVQ